jgi:hypothetical protein
MDVFWILFHFSCFWFNVLRLRNIIFYSLKSFVTRNSLNFLLFPVNLQLVKFCLFLVAWEVGMFSLLPFSWMSFCRKRASYANRRQASQLASPLILWVLHGHLEAWKPQQRISGEGRQLGGSQDMKIYLDFVNFPSRPTFLLACNSSFVCFFMVFRFSPRHETSSAHSWTDIPIHFQPVLNLIFLMAYSKGKVKINCDKECLVSNQSEQETLVHFIRFFRF